MPRFLVVPSEFQLERFRDIEVDVVVHMLKVSAEQVMRLLKASEDSKVIPPELDRYYIMHGDDPKQCRELLRSMYYETWPLHIVEIVEEASGEAPNSNA